jgi:hypothetical protein
MTSTCGSDANFDTVLSIHNISTNEELTCSDDVTSCATEKKSMFSYGVTAGTTYKIILDGYYSGDVGDYDLNITAPGGCTPDCGTRVCGPDPICGESAGGGDIGNTSVFGTTSTSTDRRAQQVTATSSGNLQSVTLYHQGGSGGILLAVYADDGGEPGARLGVTPEVTINSSEGWQTVNLTSTVSVSAGQIIWLAWVTESGAWTRAEEGTPGRASSGAGWSGGMPTDFGSASFSNYIYSIYATYVP